MLLEFTNILLVDCFHLYYINIKKLNISQSTRWFFLHSIINWFVVYYSINDVGTCLLKNNECHKITWNDNSTKVYNYAFLLHIYHCIFFKLNADDYLHHFMMVAICGTLCYMLQSIISSFALFFLSGLPGAIDYMLLYLVKRNKINTLTEKKIYTYLSAYLRAPGCTITLLIGFNGLIDFYYKNEELNFYILLLTIMIIFWNGQYYLLKSHKSFIEKSTFEKA